MTKICWSISGSTKNQAGLSINRMETVEPETLRDKTENFEVAKSPDTWSFSHIWARFGSLAEKLKSCLRLWMTLQRLDSEDIRNGWHPPPSPWFCSVNAVGWQTVSIYVKQRVHCFSGRVSPSLAGSNPLTNSNWPRQSPKESSFPYYRFLSPIMPHLSVKFTKRYSWPSIHETKHTPPPLYDWIAVQSTWYRK